MERPRRGGSARTALAAAACLAASASLAGTDARPRVTVLLDNARVRVSKASTAAALVDHPEAVVVALEDGATRKAGEAWWSGDAAAAAKAGAGDPGPVIIVEPKAPAPADSPAPSAPAGAGPGPPVFTGMSFVPLFDNERVRVIRGRMDVGAHEGFHTHASDIVVVHLSGGTIEDTAQGRTKVNHWKRGDVEFEAKGSSHSARNLGAAIEAVLVTLKP